MSFWNKKPPEGETEEQRKAREEKEEQDFIAKIGLAVESKMKPLSEKVTAWDDRWKKLEEAATAGGGDEGGEGGGEGGGDAGLSEEEKREKARQLENKKLLAVTILTNARVTEKEVLDEVKDKFPQFLTKIKEYLANTSIERKGQADYAAYCRNIVSMVIGQAAMEGGLKYDESTKSFFLEDSSAGGGGEQHEFLAADMNWTDPHTGKTMSGREQLKRLGISPEEFAKSVKEGVV
jgi:hypothetical protein